MKTDENIRTQLISIAKSGGWDTIEQVTNFNGNPVYRFRHSSVQEGAKTGYPILYTVNKNRIVYEMSVAEIHKVLCSL